MADNNDSAISAASWVQRGRQPARWDGASLAAVTEINELMLERLRAAALGAEERPRLVEGLREWWCQLDDTARQRLARCPYLLLDAEFDCAARWQPATLTSGVRDGTLAGGYFHSAAGVAVVRRSLMLAWHLARSNRLTARVLLGMNAECAEGIAGSALKHLEGLAELRPAWIVPRWEAQPLIWRQMIQAAIGGSDAALRRVQLRGLQLMAALW
jgi:hypothetical protein